MELHDPAKTVYAIETGLQLTTKPMSLFLVTAKTNLNLSGVKFSKGMSVEVHTSLLAPFNNNGKEVIAAFTRKYGIDAVGLNSLSPNDFEVRKLS